MSGEKTEKPTPKRLKQARSEGNVARTPDVGAWVTILAATVLVPKVGRDVADVARAMLVRAIDAIQHPTPEVALQLLGKGLRDSMVALLPLVAATLVVAVGATAAQGGLHPATKKLKPSFKSLNVLQGVKRMFGLMTLWEAAKIIIKTAALGLVLFAIVRRLAPQLVLSTDAPLMTTLGITAGGILTVVRASVLVGLIMAVADYLVKRRKTNKGLRMSKHDVQQEYKQAEGDPHVKGHRRSMQMAMSRNRMMADIATADVVMVNPTHVAVALRYQPGRGAPVVVAKGAGVVAAKIRERAAEHRVPLVQDVPLARALHAACEVGQEIPAELYGAVAQVLAFVMSLRAKGAAAGTHRSPVTVREGLGDAVPA
ncbi:EscU/YscU/HrcU family type III secretion system export apparatus switch protein [Angustibacter aerolatus]